jgi:solute carrier family 34 (sodium-dependent phosphate cotransporter)
MATTTSNISIIEDTSPRPIWLPYWLRVLAIFLLVFIFLVAIELLGEALVGLGKSNFQETLYAINNVFVGLFIGLLLTAILQSSSTVTSMTVAFVASGMLNLTHAIPIIMGANIGTTVTCIVVALGHITRKKEFKRGIATALSHNFFNIFITIILLPLEYFTHTLQHFSLWLAQHLSTSLANFAFLNLTIAPLAKWIANLCEGYDGLAACLAVVLLLLSIRGFTKLSHATFSAKEAKLEALLFGSPIKALLSGIFITATIRSSSVTTSLVVPLAATQRITINNAFCFIMGANVGTTVTALLAALSQSETALSIALVHVLFNVFGVLLLFPFPYLQNIILICSKTLGKWSYEHRLIGFIYLLLIFFVLPFVLILITR